MAKAIQVCTSTDCMGKGSKALWKDLEDICAGSGCEVNAGTCLNHCGKGPNVEIRVKGKQPKVIEKVDSFKVAEKVLKSELGVSMSKTERQVQEIKYEVRRAKAAPERNEKLQKAFKVLGGEDKAGSADARLASQLFVLRAKEFLESNAARALEDAQKAAALWPRASEAFLMVGLAFEKLSKWNEALEAGEKAVELGDMKEGTGLVRRMKGKAKDPPADKKAEEEAEAAKKKAAEEEEAKKKAAEEEKKKKAAEKKKKDAAAKKKAEEEAKKKAEEEARKAEEQAAEAKRLEEEAKAKAEAEAKAAAEAAEKERSRKEAEECRKRVEAEAEAARQRALQEEDEAKRKLAEDALAMAKKQATEARRLAYEASLQGRLRTCCGLPAINTDDAE